MKENANTYQRNSQKIGVKATEEVLRIADETGEDRDKLVRAFVKVMHDMVCSNTFSGYEL